MDLRSRGRSKRFGQANRHKTTDHTDEFDRTPVLINQRWIQRRRDDGSPARTSRPGRDASKKWLQRCYHCGNQGHELHQFPRGFGPVKFAYISWNSCSHACLPPRSLTDAGRLAKISSAQETTRITNYGLLQPVWTRRPRCARRNAARAPHLLLRGPDRSLYNFCNSPT